MSLQCKVWINTIYKQDNILNKVAHIGDSNSLSVNFYVDRIKFRCNHQWAEMLLNKLGATYSHFEYFCWWSPNYNITELVPICNCFYKERVFIHWRIS